MNSRKNILSIIQSKIGSAPLQRKRNDFPYVTLSYAQSVDGSISYRPGRPFSLSGPESMRMTHRLRSLHDGLLVGIGTILADNPHLTVRNANGSNPQPIIVDSRLRFPLDANVLRYGRPPWIITAPDADAERERILANAGVSILRVRSYPDGFIDLPSILKAIRKKGIESLMVEGGASIITNFLRFRLINQIVLTLAPVFVGGIQAVWPLQFEFSDLPRLINIDYAMLGQDLVMRADLNWKSS